MTDQKNMRQLCLLLYGLYMTSLLSFCADSVMASLGLVTGTLGIIFAYVMRKTVKHTPYESHIHYLIRTFWIGSGVWTPMAIILATGLIFPLSDMTAVKAAMAGGTTNILDIVGMLEQSITQHKTMVYTVLGATFGPMAVWWLWRCFKGYRLAKAGKPVTNPNSWF